MLFVSYLYMYQMDYHYPTTGPNIFMTDCCIYFPKHVNISVHVIRNMNFASMVESVILEFVDNHYSSRLIIFAGNDKVIFVFYDVTRHMLSLTDNDVGQT